MTEAKRSPLNPDTHWKIVNGARMSGDRLEPKPICVRVTHDKRGKSLSLEDGEHMIMIPLEPVADMIDTTF